MRIALEGLDPIMYGFFRGLIKFSKDNRLSSIFFLVSHLCFTGLGDDEISFQMTGSYCLVVVE